MTVRATPPRRAELLIAFCRVVLAVASLVAIYVDPLEPTRSPELAYTLLVAYAIYSIVLLLISSRSGTSLRLQIGTHVLDLVFFMVINGLTEGPVSPFFVYYVFAIVCSGLRFGTRAIVFTAAAAIAAFAASAIYSLRAGMPAGFEFNRFIIRGTYLAIIALLLIYFASYHERIKEDLSRIASWRRSRHEGLSELASDLLDHASQIFRCGRILVAFTDGTNAFAYLGERAGESFRCEELPDSVGEELVNVVRGREESNELIVPAAMIESLELGPYVSAVLEGDLVRGIVLFLDREGVVEEDLALGDVIGRIIASRLDNFATVLHLRRGAVAEERIRLARDLHDSLLQSLTGVALQLRALPRLMQRDVAAASARLEEIGDTIAADQRELRQFIEQLQSSREVVASMDIELRIAALARRFEQQWDLQVHYTLDPSVHNLTEAFRHETYSIISEAVANAAKHANARTVDVRADAIDGTISIRVTDDGAGFPFQGRYSLDELSRIKRGPVMLKERVSSLNGEMVVDSSPSGARLEITIPFTERGR